MGSPTPGPTIKFERIWHALMKVMGDGHRVQFNTNRAYIKAINRKMGIR